MNKNIPILICLLLIPAVLLCGCEKGIVLNQVAPDIKAVDINGNTVRLSDFKGKIIVLNFFATWCPPCRMEIPDLVALQDTYKDKGVAVIGVSLRSAMDLKSFAEIFGMNYPVIIGDERIVMAYGPVRSVPTTFMIDRRFRIVKKHMGMRPKEVFETEIQELLNK